MFKAFENYLMDLGKSVSDMKDEIKGHFVNAGWQVLTDTYTAGTNVAQLDLIPTAAEPVGNAVGRDVMRLIFEGTQIKVQNAYQSFLQRPRVFDFHTTSYPYNDTVGLTIGATVVNVTAPDGNYTSALTYNARLIAALTADPGILQGWVLTQPKQAPFNQFVGYDPLEGFRLTELAYGSGAPLSALKKLEQRTIFDDVAPNTILASPRTVHTLPIDLAGGWVYFLSVLSRSFVLGALTNTGVYGPILGSYTDHAAALAGAPAGCMPVELLTGKLEADRSAGLGRPSTHDNDLTFGHVYGFTRESGSYLGDYWPLAVQAFSPTATAKISDFKPTNLVQKADQAQDDLDGATNCLIGANEGAFYAGTAVGGITTPSLYGSKFTSNATHTSYIPGYSFPDLLVNFSNVGNFTLVLTQRVNEPRPLAAPLAVDGVALTLVDGSNLPSAGAVVIEGEIIEYTGRNGNTLTGLTRGRYGSVAAAHAQGAAAIPGDWNMRLNAMMLPCGPVRPGLA